MDIEAMLELPAGRELDRVVAEALGWTNIEETVYWIDDYDGSEEITAWEGVPPDTHSTRLVPRYSTDANAALSLWERFDLMKYCFDIAFAGNGFVSIELTIIGEHDGYHADVKLDRLPLATVRAWLAHRKADTQ